MKVSLSGKCTSKNVFGMTGNQIRYVVTRSKRPQAMTDYLMGNWFTSAISTVGTGISNSVNAVANAVKSVVTPGNVAKALPVAIMAPIALPAAAAGITVRQIIENDKTKQQQEALRQVELAKLENERVALLNKKNAEELAAAKQAASLQPQIQQASLPASYVASSFDFKKLLPFAAIAATLPFLLSGNK